MAVLKNSVPNSQMCNLGRPIDFYQKAKIPIKSMTFPCLSNNFSLELIIYQTLAY